MINIDLHNREDLGISDIEFLKVFKNEDDMAFFRLIHDVKGYSKNESSTLEMIDDEYAYMRVTFKRYQKKGYGIFFVVQSGGQRKENIRTVNAQLIDADFRKYDSGERDEKGHIIWSYRSDQEVEDLKIEFLKVVDGFLLEPSVINETKNGFHLYWLIDKTKPYNIKKYRSIELKMVEYFGEYADDNVCDLARVMRIPGYLHQKDPSHPYLVKCIKFDPKIRYTQEQMAKAIGVQLDLLEDDIPKVKVKAQKKDSTIKNELAADVSIEPEEKKPWKEKEPVKVVTQTFYNYPDLIDYIKRQNPVPILKELLPSFPDVAEGELFQCVFHNDSTPSAKLWVTERGHYKYKCFGKCCLNHQGEDIFDLVGRLKGTEFKETLDYIMPRMGIGLIKTKWMQEQMDKYVQNLSARVSKKISEDMQEKYPNFYKLMARGKGWAVWEKIMNIGLTNIHPGFMFKHQSVVFFSNRFLMRLLGNSSAGTTNQYINLLATLGLIEKLKEKDVPDKLLERAYKEYEKDKDNEEIICFYICNNVFDVIREAESRAEKMLESGFSIKGMGKKYLVSVFGQEFADSIYDYEMESEYTQKKEKVIYTRLIEMLKKKRYFSYKDIRDAKVVWCRRSDGKRIYINRFDKERLFKRCAGKIINDYKELEIKKQRLNKELKDKLKIQDAGFYDIYFISNNKKLI